MRDLGAIWQFFFWGGIFATATHLSGHGCSISIVRMDLLPAGWSKQFSKTHQRDYWFNSADGTRRWEPPEEDRGKAKRARTSPLEAAAVVINEDSPELSLERARLLGECFEVFVSENSKFGNMCGSSKTAKSCMKDGMRVGSRGDASGDSLGSRLCCRSNASVTKLIA